MPVIFKAIDFRRPKMGEWFGNPEFPRRAGHDYEFASYPILKRVVVKGKKGKKKGKPCA